jgi:DNA-binding NarL/FixJ family response regulator
MREMRSHRPPLDADQAARVLEGEVAAGRLEADSVAAVLEATGMPRPELERPGGLTAREGEVLSLVALGFQTKQVAHRLGISAKTADRHIQNAYQKLGVSTRAAATLFAMEHGLVSWGELPIHEERVAP